MIDGNNSLLQDAMNIMTCPFIYYFQRQEAEEEAHISMSEVKDEDTFSWRICGNDFLKIKAKDVSNSINKALDVHLEKEDGSNSLLRNRSKNELPQRERHLDCWATIGDLFTGCPAGNENDNCLIVCPCKSWLTCEAWVHICRVPGKLGDPCHLTCHCDFGFKCQPWVHKCYNVPRLEGQPCVASYRCKSGLTCEAGAHV
eukprot:13246497-Ditylum_brightwellii.AAC.1